MATAVVSAFLDALEKVELGAARRVMPQAGTAPHRVPRSRPRAARMLQPGADPVRKVSSFRAAGAGRHVVHSRHRSVRLRRELPARTHHRALGGMAAEQEVFNVVTTGPESDLEAVTRIARSMVGRWGCRSESAAVGPAGRWRPAHGGISDELLNLVDEEVRRITDDCYAEPPIAEGEPQQLDAMVVQLLAHKRWTNRRSTRPRA